MLPDQTRTHTQNRFFFCVPLQTEGCSYDYVELVDEETQARVTVCHADPGRVYRSSGPTLRIR